MATKKKEKKKEHGTDNPLKRLFKGFPQAFAEWLIEDPIENIEETNIELPVSSIRSDQVFTVTLANGKEIVFHVEFEAKDDTEVMKWRMLNYMSRIGENLKKPIQSVVLYMNKKGRGDTGEHRIGAVRWSYKAIRLDEMEASEFLKTNNPAMWALSALAKRKEPEEEAFEAVDKIRRNADNKSRTRLLELFLTLLHDERLVEMIQEQLEKEDYLMNSPFIRRMKDKGREEGRDERSYEIARNMRQEGMGVEQIARLTGLSIEEVKELYN